jgi:hypothetical protein
VGILLDHGADVNARVKYCTPLQHAVRFTSDLYFEHHTGWESEKAWHGWCRVVALLLEAGADPNPVPLTPDFWDCSPLAIAVMNGCEPVVRLLLDAGAHCSTHWQEHVDVFREACSSDRASLMRLMLDSQHPPTAAEVKRALKKQVSVYRHQRKVCAQLLLLDGC